MVKWYEKNEENEAEAIHAASPDQIRSDQQALINPQSFSAIYNASLN